MINLLRLLIILFTGTIYCQIFEGTTDFDNAQALKFQSATKSPQTFNITEIGAYKVIDTINKLEALLNKNTKIVSVDLDNPEAYLIEDFENKSGTISIAVGDNEKFTVYEILSPNMIFTNYQNDSLNSEKMVVSDLLASAPKLKIKEVKRIKLDKFKGEELMIKFSYQVIGCTNCNQSQATTINGYVIFDFDKLQRLILINFNGTSLSQQLADMGHRECFKIEFKKNFVKIKSKKYYYKNNSFVRK